ncbi:MAG: GNAT family N-acetyltransferase [Defluviitaleaceae bacterium]|nr:GNAT family N-acetyltransferase [Defluviitaleaceae bacterium]
MKIYETLDSGIKIVDYTPSHAPSLAEFWNICGQEEDGDWGGESGIKTASEVISQHNTASHYNVYLALDGETVVGYCSFGRYYYDANTAYIPLLGVRPDYRSKKIGKALVLQCVKRTIELGYPRLDLFTWSGNTAAVPLYKKCGFMWEDRSDGTHFANFVPTILTTPLFADFFKKADWYADSTRSFEIIPDGTKLGGFELFEYSWEKNGESLNIGYERSGRQMRMIETPDYKIELITKDHELAFGMDYECTFAIENKTGKELNIKITGREDKNIKLDCKLDLNVTGKEKVNTSFYVGPADEPQDLWKVHPCLLADIEINGQAVTFGLGINAKFPLIVNLNRECMVDQIGLDVKTHISIQSALAEDAKITVKMPKSSILAIKGAEKPFVIDIPAKGKASIPTTSTTLAIGFEKPELDCIALLKSGKEISFTAPAFIFTRDMTHAFYGEDFYTHKVFNGPWGLNLRKDENEVDIIHLTNKGFNSEWAFQPPKLGKPYDDEFNLIKPNVKSYNQAGAVVMEAEFVSEKFPGLVVTQIYTLYATGLVTRTSKVENRSDKPRQGMLQDTFGFGLGFNAIFSYKGQITQNNERYSPSFSDDGFDNIDSEDVDENWAFKDDPAAPRGFIWPKEYKPNIKWGAIVSFEIDLGELAPGQVFETKPVIYAFGLFTNYNDLRNYALQVYNQTTAPVVLPMEVKLNDYNPFVTTSEIKLDIINNRDEVQEGTITVSSDSIKSALSQSNPHEDVVEENNFELSLNPTEDIGIVNVAMNMVGYEKTVPKAVFFPKGEVVTTQEGNLFSVTNGAITFKADPNYSRGCFSLTDAKGQEWFLNQYPEHKPFSWFNPFIGGMRICLEDMDDRTFLKEKTTAGFVDMRDSLGNLWQGICVTLTVVENEKLKGAVYKNYFLTQPGLPVICTFFQLENNTGEYKGDRTYISTCLMPDEDAKNVIVEVIDKDGGKHRKRMGSLDTPEYFFEGTMVISGSRAEKLYGICNSKDTDFLNDFWGSNKVPVMATFTHTHVKVAHGETFTSNPAFLVITDKELPQGALNDFERIRF